MVRLLITFLLFIAVPSFADRTVSFVPTERNGVQISNPSSVSQSVTVICKKEDGVVIINKAATIPSGGSTLISLSACKYNELDGYNNGMYRCSGSGGGSSMITYASAASACAVDHHVCNISEYAANVGGAAPSSSAWLTHSGTFSQSYCSTYPSSCSWSDYSTSGYYPTTMSGADNYCATSSAGGGTHAQFCSFSMATNTQWGVMCCPNSTPIPAGVYGFCSITVTGDSGYLITPSFKGGAPF